MNFFNQRLLFIFFAITACAPLFCYELFFSNFTDKFLIIASKKRAGIIEKFYQIVAPGGSVIQVWDDANCLESLQWTELNENLPLKGGKDLIDPKQGYQIPRNKQDIFRKTFTNINDKGKGLYLWNNLKIIMVPNEIFKQTREAATKLVEGFDTAACQSVDTIIKSNDVLFAIDQAKKLLTPAKTQNECLSNLAQIADAAGKIAGISICTNRQFAIFDTGKEDELTGMPLLIAETGEGE